MIEKIDNLNSGADKIQIKIKSIESDQEKITENLENSFKNIKNLQFTLEEQDKIQKNNLNKVESRFNPINILVSNLQGSLETTTEKIISIEKEIQISRNLIFETENTLINMISQYKPVEKPQESEEKIVQRKISISDAQKDTSDVTQKLLKDIENLKASLINSAKETEEKLSEEVANNIKLLNEKVAKIREENEESFKVVNEKLNWFPVNVNQIAGMTPNQARLFTLEARLRSEENSRIKAFNFLGKQIENLRIYKEIGPYTDKSIAREKRDSPDGAYTLETLKKLGENDRKNESKDFYSHLIDGSIHEDIIDLANKHKTPKSRDYSHEIGRREIRTSSVMGRKFLRKTLNQFV